jgi:YesN/AraC family two-component response regulator
LDGLPFKEENRRYLPYCVKLDELILLAGTSRKEELDEAAKELLQMESSFSPAEEEFLCRSLRKIIPDLPKKKGFGKTLAAYLEKSGQEGQDKQSVLVQQALRIIREEYHQEIGIAQIAYKLQVTPNYLSSLFRKHAGLPFTRYITEIRINKARRLLKETSLNIKEIASEVGYQSSRHFSGLFRQETGLTPTEYIRKYRA